MDHFHPIKLELLRTGPPHNQLLSPLTPYIALCGNSWPITLQIRHEHHRFLSRLERLRYAVQQGQDVLAVPDRVREATVNEVGQDVAEILGTIPSLLSELAGPRGMNEGMPLAHLSLVLGGSELALIPFELAFSPQAFPGEGLEFCLQLALPVVPTRQSRRSLPAFATWDAEQKPKLLVISAAPAGLEVPLAEHLHALRAAIEPWVGWPAGAGVATDEAAQKEQQNARLPLVKQHMRVLANASLEQIQEACASERYTHVHVLAHGGVYELGGERQFGVVLCDRVDKARAEVVSGKRLAKALQARSLDGSWRSSPFMVTLATCDSGHPGSVLVPGGGIAHDLHDEGIPWVIASQFPLTKAGSVLMAEGLYPGLLRGDDPRLVLHELRRKLYLSTQRSHDWASIVAYASLPRTFDDSLTIFFERQSRRAIDICFARADELANDNTPAADIGLEAALGQIRSLLQVWLGRLPASRDEAARERRAECYGMHGSAFKRIALQCSARGKTAQAAAMLRDALGYYRQAMNEWAAGSHYHGGYHWVAVQVLSLTAVLQDPPDQDTFDVVLHLAGRHVQGTSAAAQAWNHGALAELEMLSLYHARRPKPGGSQAHKLVTERVIRHCRAIVDLTGKNSFHVESTRRQFDRYVRYWDGEWTPVAKAAIQALSPPSG